MPIISVFLSGKKSFNSTLVQLKVLTGLQGKAQEISFNSTLVQLKGF